MKLSEKQLLLLTIVIPAIVAIALAGVGFFKFSKDISKLSKEIDDVNNQIKEENIRLEKMVELRDKLKLKLISQKKAFAQKKALNTLASTTNQQLLHDVINCVERYIIR